MAAVRPNPFSDRVTVTVGSGLAGKIGKPGVYLLKMRDAHARSAAVKLVKQ